MTVVQDSILHLNFTQRLQKSINDKISLPLNNNKDGKSNGGGKYPGKKTPGGGIERKQDFLHNNDKNHSHWCLKMQSEGMT